LGITYSSVVPAPIAKVLAWHERPGATLRLLPPWLPIRVLEEPDSLEHGRTVLRLPGLSWVVEREDLGSPDQFADRLVSLPLGWRHVSSFAPASPSTTTVTDVVETPVPSPLLRQVFRYRHRQLADDLERQREMAALAPEPLTVALTGASGLVGSALESLLSTGGHRVVRLVRRPPKDDAERQWRPDTPDPRLFDGVDAVVHLAGASIAGRFNPSHKRSIRDSRVGPTAGLAQVMAQSDQRPATFVVASAIGYYGADRGDEWLAETSSPGDDFLARLVVDWEAATSAAEESGVRVVRVRTGIAQSPRGGTLRLLRPLFTAGLGGPIGGGGQWTSWIDLDDLTDIYYRAIVDPSVSGPVNAVAPEPVRGRDYASTLGAVLRRPAVLPVPTLGPRLLLGEEGAHELALASQRVRPAALATFGHRFRWPTVESSLRHQLGRLSPS
jgi:uncharacterized protein (TIGR01777 family)